MTSKVRILIIVGLTLLAVFIGWLITRSSGLAKPEEVASVRMLGPALSGDGQSILYFDRTNNRLASFSLTSKTSTIIDQQEFIMVHDLAWSPDRRQVIMRITNSHTAKVVNPLYTDKVKDGDLTVWLYNLDTKEKKFVSSDIGAVVWKSSGDGIYYQFQLEDSFQLSTSKPDGSSWVNLVDLEGAEVRLALSSSGRFLAYNRPAVTVYDLISKKKFVIDKEPVNTLIWQNDSQIVAAITTQGRKPADEIIRFDINGRTKTISRGLPAGSIKELLVSSAGQTLYFTSDDKLYKLKLP